MKSFKEYCELNEFNLITIFKTAFQKIKDAFAKLKFGNTQRIVIPSSAINEAVDLKSRLGYLSEFSTASALSELISRHGYRLTPRSEPEKLTQLYHNKKTELEQLGADIDEISRADSAGKKLGEAVFKDVNLNGEDIQFVTFDIELTGDSAKGKSKADLVLNITKDSENVVLDKIVASLKAYKKPAINLANSTYISLIKTLFYDKGTALPSTSEGFIVKFVEDFGAQDEMAKLYAYQNIITTQMKTGTSKADARTAAKATHADVIEIIAKIIKDYYPQHRAQINARVLQMLGFDGEDDFYAAIGTKNQKIISSRRSPELQTLVKNLASGFNLEFGRHGQTTSANMTFKTIETNAELLNVKFTFADTGGSSAQGKTNAFFNFAPYLK